MHVTYLRDDYFTLVNQTERITIFTLYLAVENKMLKKAGFFLQEKHWNYVVKQSPASTSGKKREN